MGSLKYCLTINDCPPNVADKIRTRQKEYLADGYDGAAATAKAVEDILGDVVNQRASLVDQVNNQIKEKSPDLASKEEHPMIEELRQELGEDLTQVDANTKAAQTVKKMANRFGKKVVFFKGSNKSNGFFNPKHPDTLFVNVDAHDTMVLFTFGHELLHSLKKQDRKLYVKLFKVLYNHVEDFDTFYAEQNANRVKQGMKKLDEAGMAEEFFSDFTGEQFTDPKFWEKLAETDQTLFQKLAELFQQVFDSMKVGVSQKNIRALSKAQDALAGVLKEYAEQAKISERSPTTGDSVHNLRQDIKAFTGENPETKFSVHERPAGVRALELHFRNKLGLSEKKADKKIVKDLAEDYYASLGESYQDYIDQIENNKDFYPKMGTGSLPGNSDPTYQLTVDLVGACVRMMRAMAIHNHVRDTGGSMPAFQMRALETELSKKGFELTCAYCFAFTRRANAVAKLEWMKGFLEDGSVPSKAFDGKGELGYEDLWKAALQEVKDNPNWLEAYEALPDLVAIKTPSDVKTLEEVSPLAAQFRKDYPAIHALKQKETDAGNMRMPTGNIAIAGQIIKLKDNMVAKLLKWGGLRWQSNIDFIPAMTYDYVQGVVEMAIRNLPGHVYTKEVDLSVLVANSGFKINLSAAPLVRKGKTVWEKDTDGNRRPKLDIGIGSMTWRDVEESMVAGKDHQGVMMLGVNDEILTWASAEGSKWAPFVIPWHSSGMPAFISKTFKDVIGARDYSDDHEALRVYESIDDIPERFRKIGIKKIGKDGKDFTIKKKTKTKPEVKLSNGFVIDYTQIGKIDSAWEILAKEYAEQQEDFRSISKVDNTATLGGFNIPTGFIIDQTVGVSDTQATEQYFELVDELNLIPLFESYRQRYEAETGEHHGANYWVLKKHYARTDTPLLAPDPKLLNYDHAKKMDAEWVKSDMAKSITEGNSSFIEAFNKRELTSREKRQVDAAVKVVKSNPEDPMRPVLEDIKMKKPAKSDTIKHSVKLDPEDFMDEAKSIQDLAEKHKGQYIADIKAIAGKIDGIVPVEAVHNAVKLKTTRIAEKLAANQNRKGQKISDVLRTMILAPNPAHAGSPKTSGWKNLVYAMKQKGYEVWVREDGKQDIDNLYENEFGYKHVAIKFVKEGQKDPLVRELLIISPNMYHAKEIAGGHDLYEITRALKGKDITADVAEVRAALDDFSDSLYEAAFKTDEQTLTSSTSPDVSAPILAKNKMVVALSFRPETFSSLVKSTLNNLPAPTLAKLFNALDTSSGARSALVKLIGLSPSQLVDRVNKVSEAEAEVNSQEQRDPTSFSVRTKPDPKKTIKAYKLFRVKKTQPGKLFPLYIDATLEVEQNKWLDADFGDNKKAGLAPRPGWHMGDSPMATHIGGKKNPADKTSPVAWREDDTVWAEVDVADDVDWQTEANNRTQFYKSDSKVTGAKKGDPRVDTAEIKDELPVDGNYRFKTNPNMTGTWIIGGAIKVNKTLTDAEVSAINDEAGVKDLPRRKPLDLVKWGLESKQSLKEIDAGVEPTSLPEEHDRYFNMEKATIVSIDQVNSTKTDAENAQGGTNAPKRMRAAFDGKLGKRDPISVKMNADGSYNIIEGNGTFAGVNKHGWKEIPVNIISDIKYSVSPGMDVAKFRKEMQKAKNGELKEQMLEVGTTPSLLKAVGVAPLKLVMSQDAFFKIIGGKKGDRAMISDSELANIVYQLHNPVAVFNSATEPGSFVIVTDMKDSNGSPIIVAIHPKRKGVGRNINVNVFASAYGKDGFDKFFKRELGAKRVMYVNKEKGLVTDMIRRLQLPKMRGQKQARFEKILSEEIKGVKSRFSVKGFDPTKKASDDAFYSYYDRLTEVKNEVISDFVNNSEGKQRWKVVPAKRLQKIWSDFSASGVVKDTSGLEKIVDVFIENTMKLQTNTELMGHTQLDPVTEFDDHGVDNPEEVADQFAEYAVDDNGAWRISDYGLDRLAELASRLLDNLTAEETVVVLDMMLNVVHQRSDMAASFVQGGSTTLTEISQPINITENDDIHYSTKSYKDVIKEKFDTDADGGDTVVNRIVNGFKIAFNGEDRSKWLDDARTYMVDRYNPIDKKLGSTIYKLHRMLNNSAATVGTFLQHGKMSWNGSAITVTSKNDGFVPWIQGLGKDGHFFMYWVAAKRAEKLEAEDRENWLDKPARDEIFAEAKRRDLSDEQLNAWNKELQEFNGNVMDIAEGAGLISAEAREAWMSDFYIPFYRLLEKDGDSDAFLQAPTASKKFINAGVKTLKGGESMLGDPMDNLIQNWTHLITESQRQMARKGAGEMMINMGMAKEMTTGSLIKVLGVNSIYGAKGMPGARGNVSWKDFEGMTKAEVQNIVDDTPGARLIEKQVIRTANKETAGVMSFMRNGKPVYIQVDDADLYEALTQVNTKALDNGLIMGASWFKRLLTRGATFGAGFRIANLLRDTIHTSVVSKSFVPFLDTAKGLVKVLAKSPEYIELMASGGGFGQGYLNSGDPQALSKSIRSTMVEEGLGTKKGMFSRAGKDDTLARNVLDTPRKMLAFWERLGHASEMAARVQLYTNLKAGGKSHMDAAYEARDLLDFALSGRGNVIRIATAVTPFLNARLQGLDRMARGAKANPAGFAVRGAIVTAVSLAIWAWHKDDERYKELEDFQKWQYHHFWIGDEHIKIPKAFEVGAIFSTMFEAAGDTMIGDEDFNYFVDMLGHTATSTFALGTPTVFTPILETWANKSFFTGRELEPEWMQKLDQGVRSHPWTSASLKTIGEATGVSPIKLQTFIRGYTATIGMGILSVTDAMMEFREDVNSPRKYFHEYVGLDRFVTDRVKSTKYSTRYHEYANELTQFANTVNFYISTGDMEMAMKMAAERPDYKGRKSFINFVNTQLSNVRRQEKMIWSDKTMPRESKDVRLERLKARKQEIYRNAYINGKLSSER